LVRKFIILNIEATPATTVGALAFAVIVLGVVYWLMRERDDRVPTVQSRPWKIAKAFGAGANSCRR
ncbi:MAG TPA: phosphate-starvation-inducible PsiE family protein, partial [Chthoniobacterales bacterium]|nr:phosphate-starvation-inducible PsiE family protein [Chthoniobacterales bacterium]